MNKATRKNVSDLWVLVMLMIAVVFELCIGIMLHVRIYAMKEIFSFKFHYFLPSLSLWIHVALLKYYIFYKLYRGDIIMLQVVQR